jgi:lipid-A-disaccharide synthase
VAAYDRDEFCRRHNLDPARPIISLLPGSRHKELARILPPMIDAAREISQQRDDVQFVIVVAPNRDPQEATEIIAARHSQVTFRLIHHETREALAASDAAAIASGTATLEAALLGTPMVIVYRESPINWHVLGSLIKVEHYGLVNLIAGRRVATELMQSELNGARLSRELIGLVNPDRNREVRHELTDVVEKLGSRGASAHAAETILQFLSKI